MRHGARLFGKILGQACGVSDPQCLALQSDNVTLAAITYMHSPAGFQDPTQVPTPEKGFTITVHLVKPNALNWGSWVGSRYTPTPFWDRGGIGIFDLESLPRVLRDTSFEVIHFNLPRATLNAFTEDAELPTVGALHCSDGHPDPVLYHFAEMIRPNLCEKIELPGLFLDNYLQTLCSHVVLTYGEHQCPNVPYKGGLAPWQRRRALELLDENLAGDLRLNRLAAECGISTSYFCRCFRSTFGTSLHKFVVNKRVEKAKQLLLQSNFSIAEIAIAAGFSDQAAFSRTFSASMGVPPARWRVENAARVRLLMNSGTASSRRSALGGEETSNPFPIPSIPAFAGSLRPFSRIGRITSPTFQ